MTEDDLIKMAHEAVAADLRKLLFDRPEITARVSSGSEARFVHGWIRSIVEGLQDDLGTCSDGRGIDLKVES